MALPFFPDAVGGPGLTSLLRKNKRGSMKDKVLPLETFIGKTKREGKIPDKLYFRISEVSKLTGLEPYVLRYWGSEFKSIKPIRTKSRHRLYRRRDLEVLFEIKNYFTRKNLRLRGLKNN